MQNECPPEIKGQLLNKDGKVVKEIYEGDSLRVTRKASIDAWRRRDIPPDKLKMPYDSFLKVNTAEMEALSKELSSAEMSFLCRVQCFLAFNSCILEYSNHVPLDVKSFAKELDMSEATVYRVLKSLKHLRILCSAETGGVRKWIMNPWIASRGTYVNATLRGLFREYRVRSHGNMPWGNMK